LTSSSRSIGYGPGSISIGWQKPARDGQALPDEAGLHDVDDRADAARVVATTRTTTR
jgi:hypothetical protein